MWIIITIAAIILIIFLNTLVGKKIANKIELEGGIKSKYNLIVSAFLSEPNTEIIIDRIDTFKIKYQTNDAITYFTFIPLPNGITIKWSFVISNVSSGKIDTLNKTWDFRDSIGQNRMLELILNGMQAITIQYFQKRGIM